MKKIFIISDTHYNHPAIIDFCNRPKDYQKKIIKRWNSKVREDDLVIHLWDVIFDRPSELFDINRRLNWTKVLVRGNHDKRWHTFYMNNWFSFVVDELRYNIEGGRELILSHIPKWKLTGNQLNIHGHLHNSWHRGWWGTDRHILYSPEIENYFPILMDDLIKRAWKSET